MLSTLEPESAYSAFNLNLLSELAPLHPGGEPAKPVVVTAVPGPASIAERLELGKTQEVGSVKFFADLSKSKVSRRKCDISSTPCC